MIELGLLVLGVWLLLRWRKQRKVNRVLRVDEEHRAQERLRRALVAQRARELARRRKRGA